MEKKFNGKSGGESIGGGDEGRGQVVGGGTGGDNSLPWKRSEGASAEKQLVLGGNHWLSNIRLD